MKMTKEKQWKIAKPILWTIGILFALMILIAIFAPKEESTDSNTQDESQTETTQETGKEELARLSTELADKARSERFDDGNQCSVGHVADSSRFLNDKGLARNATTLFVETGKKVFEDDNCHEFVLFYDATGEDGNVRIAHFPISKEQFNGYNWESLHGKPVGIQLEQDNAIGIPMNSSLTSEDFIYN